ncbi:glucose 1-dehydrogenase [Streptomyces sp. NPDC048277]|uniref:SDR family NAD(P)-dependent oxidoreductase n=1 Tax=Streptomyces sp. NPDC048277 TaxID=3155027 RepID=UPI0033E999AD
MADINAGLSLAGKVAIVTGAGQGLGRDIALAMARAGAQVAVVDLNPETAQRVAAELGENGKAGIAITCDVSRRDQVRAAVERTVSEWGGIDILVNNAHNLRVVQARFMDTDDEHLLRHLNSGLFGTYYFLQESYEHLKARGGRVVNLGSGAGVSGRQEHFSYAATKEAIRATTRVVAREWGPEGIRVNTICPAAYDTPAMKRFLSNADDEQTAAMTAQIPLARFGGGDEVASVAVFLASDASSYMTGHTLMVDGGATMDAGR